jgi:hypothetical protein
MPQPKLKRRTSSTEENRQADSEAEMARFELADVSGSFVDRHSSPGSTNTVYSLQQSNIISAVFAVLVGNVSDFVLAY